MGPGQPSRSDSSDSFRPGIGGGLSRPRLLVPIGLVVLFVALLRWAIDFLFLLSALLLLAHATRDTLQDWMARESFDGEPDPVWAVGAVSAGLLGTVIAGFWLAASSHTGSRVVERYAPAVLTRAVAIGEQYGWGGRTFWPDPSRAAAQTTGATESRSATLKPLSRWPAASAATSGAGDDAPTGSPQAPVATLGQVVQTQTTLRASATEVPRGTAVRLIADVAGSSRPTGTIVFRRAAMTIDTAALDRHGRATVIVTDLPPGTHEITAEFLGSPTLKPSQSATIRIAVR